MKSKELNYLKAYKNTGTDLSSYKKNGGYKGFKKALQLKPSEIINEVEDSKLRGRGGAGFPTGLKWELCKSESDKYLVCNADEGEPGTFKDRYLMTNSPFLLIEGMTIAGYAVGAKKGYIYIRGEYPEIYRNIKTAIETAEKEKFLGENIAENFSFSIEVKLGGGSYVVGDETALLHSLMGYRGTPWKKPPYPAQKGLWDKPTIINNVETLACIPLILSFGSTWFKEIGTKQSPGPKLYCVSGNVKNPGVYEYAMGVTLKELIEAAGGVSEDFKAVQIGGTAGPVYNSDAFDFKLDYESMKHYGGILGSGAVVVLNTSVSMSEVLEVEMRFFAEESCGKCFPCRYGTRQLSYMADKIVTGTGKEEFLDLMIETAEVMKGSSFCSFGKSVVFPVKTIINTFGEEIRSSIRHKNYVMEDSQ